MKTILKLYPNGDIATVETTLIQSNMPGGYSFAENLISIPKIIEYPPNHLKNYFVEKTLIPGWTTGEVVYPESHNYDRVSEFINIDGWTHWTIRVEQENLGSLIPEFRVLMYGENMNYVYTKHNYDFNETVVDGVLTFTLTNPLAGHEKFMRFSINHYGNPTVITRIVANKGITSPDKHYLAYEDMPSWVQDTGHPISIFPEGIVIKGDFKKQWTLFRDDFNRPNANNLGPDWEIISGGFSIIEGVVYNYIVVLDDSFAVTNVGIQKNVSIELGVLKPNIHEGIAFRVVDATNYIRAHYNSSTNSLKVTIKVNNIDTVLAETSLSLIRGQSYSFRVDLRDEEIKVFIDNELKLTTSESRFIDTEKCGMIGYSMEYTSGGFDNFEVKKWV